MDFSAIGRTGTPFTMPIEAGKVREFAEATGSTNPAYFGDEPPVPPTFLITQLFWQHWAGEEADPWRHVRIDLRRALHARQEYRFFGPPPRAGGTLRAQSRIEDIYQRTGRRGGVLTFGVMVTDFHDENLKLVAQARMTGVESEHPVAMGAPAPATVVMDARWSTGPAALVVGPVTVTDFVRYQGASGDFNPLHHDPEFARSAGYSAPVGIGLFGAGLTATYATQWLGVETVRRFTVRFVGQIWAGDTLTIQGARTGTGELDGEPVDEVELVCCRQDGQQVIAVAAAFVSGR